MSEQNDPYLISHFTLRKAIGWLGMLLPFILLIGNWLINNSPILSSSTWVVKCCNHYHPYDSWKQSISHYYYTTMGEAFTGILIAVGLFLICYKGHKKRAGDKGLSDDLTSTLAGIFAFLVVIFPTGNEEVCIEDNFRVFLSSDFTGKIHLVFACLFFAMLIHMCWFNFRRSDTVEKFGTGEYQFFYKICAIVMFVCIVLCAIYILWLEEVIPSLAVIRPVFLLEGIALIFFGLSWLTKGKVDYYYFPKKVGLKK